MLTMYYHRDGERKKDSMIYEEIGKRIRELRESKDMSQEELTLKLGYKNRSTIAKTMT